MTAETPWVESGPRSADIPTDVSGLSLPQLMQLRQTIEAEMDRLHAAMVEQGASMGASLTDAEGFPGSDIDVPQRELREAVQADSTVRHMRSQFVRRQTDLANVGRALEAAVTAHYALPDEQRAQAAALLRSAAVAPALPRVFARVASVEPNSPASAAGLVAGDGITRFGPVDASTRNPLPSIARHVQAHESVRRAPWRLVANKVASHCGAGYLARRGPRPLAHADARRRLGWPRSRGLPHLAAHGQLGVVRDALATA